MSGMDHYASYYSSGMKIGVGIPLPNSEVFRDWAVISEIDEDLVSLQLSRDQLPEGVDLHVGQIVELRGGRDDTAYSCRAIIVNEGQARQILLRLIGEIVTDELREFYRIDAFLPIKYFASLEQNPGVLKKEWQVRRQKRLDDDMLRKQQRWDSAFVSGSDELSPEQHQEQPDLEPDETDSLWDTIVPLAASISGGGMRIIAPQGFDVGDYVPLEIMVPEPRRIVEAVGRVVFCTRNYGAPGERENFNVALKFVFIDERDRDAIVNHISTVQLKRIRQLREQFSLRSGDDSNNGAGGAGQSSWRSNARNIVYMALFAVIVVMLINYFHGYLIYHPKSEIEETFETGIKNYLKKLGR
jgi:hypothetical protein